LIQGRLLTLAASFLAIYALALTLSPAALARSWSVAYRWDHWLGYALWLGLMVLAHRETTRRLPERDPYLLPAAALLSGLGLMTIWRLYPYFGIRQVIWLVVTVGLFTAGLRLPKNLAFLRRYKYLWLTGGLLLTALTLLFGTNPNGSSSPHLWLGCCGVYFQPSEPLKFLLIVYLAAYLADARTSLRSFTALSSKDGGAPPLLPLLAPTLIMTGLAMLLLVVQRDLGTATIFLFLYAAVVYVTSGRKRILVVSGLATVLAGAAGYALFDVVRLRMDAWLNPWLDPSGRSFQIVQSLLAVANGGLLGRGPGLGSPGLVPVPHSDFIFAAITEENGLIGAIGLLLVIGIIADRGLRIALSAPDSFRRYLAAGLTAHLVAQSILIIGGNLRLLPLTGVTLPFVSYGGSSLLVSFISLLILVHISNQIERRPAHLVNIRPYMQLSGLLLVGLGAAGLATGWWALYRGPDLLTRTDNPRRAIADRYVKRGAILDRRNEPLAATSGQTGDYTRQVIYPPLSVIIGYTNPIYGQSNLEASMDSYLRGLQGYPELTIWWNHLLYGQPPPGLDIRLSLDLSLQRTADQAFGSQTGALVLLNAKTGEILAMASHPGFDANQLDTQWKNLVQDSNAPLLNRAASGQYPIGDLQKTLYPEGISAVELEAPQIRLPVANTPAPGEAEPALSPLQVALSAAALSDGGIRPAPSLVMAVNTTQAGWVLLPSQGEASQIMPAVMANATVNSLSQKGTNLWQNLAAAPNGTGKSVTWYVGGTLPSWSGSPLAIAVLLEDDNPALAAEIGQQTLQAAMQP
jgi:cell division protein FtsW (lipid II flippase)